MHQPGKIILLKYRRYKESVEEQIQTLEEETTEELTHRLYLSLTNPNSKK